MQQQQQQQIAQLYWPKTVVMPSLENDYLYNVYVSTESNLVTATSSQNIIKLYELSTMNYIGELSGHTGPVRGVRFLNGGEHVLTCSVDGSVKLFDVKQRACMTTLNLNIGELNGIDAFAPDNAFAVCGEDGSVVIGELKRMRQKYKYELHAETVQQVQFCPVEQLPPNIFIDDDEKQAPPPQRTCKSFLFSAGVDGCVNIMDHTVQDDEDTLIQVVSTQNSVAQFGFARSNKMQTDLLFAVSQTHDLSLWNIAQSQQVGTAVNRTAIKADYIISALYTPFHDALYCFAGDNSGGMLMSKYLVANNVGVLQPITLLPGGHSDRVLGVWTSEDMKTVISCGEDSKLVMWSTEKQTPVSIASPKHKTSSKVFAAAKTRVKPY